MGQNQTLYQHFGSVSDFLILRRMGFDVKVLSLNLKQRSIFLIVL